MYKKTLTLILSFVFSVNISLSKENDYLDKLDKFITERAYYMQLKEDRIDSLKKLTNNTELEAEKLYEINYKIFYEYYAYRYDDAMEYVLKNKAIAKELKDQKLLNQTLIDISRLLTNTGMYRESMDHLELIDRNSLSRDLLIPFYSAYEGVYYAAKEYSNDELFSPEYEKLEFLYRDSITALLPKHSISFKHYQAKTLRQSGMLEYSLKLYLEILEEVNPKDSIYAIIAFDISSIYNRFGDVLNYQKYLALSAVADIQSAQKENHALQLLAISLYTHNPKELDRMFTYIQCAMEDARFYNSRLRIVQISEILPLIVNAYKEQRDKISRNLTLLVIGVSILFCAVLLLAWYNFKQVDKVKSIKLKLEQLNAVLMNTNEKLRISNKTKEEYIGLFSDLCTSYIHKLDEFRVTVKRKIVSKQIDRLFARVNSTFSIEQELKDFFDVFDNAFLKIFPSFVDDFNLLLKPDEQLVLKNGELLNRELRIYALIRLGISDSSKIAAFLHYSPQTIYNNRTKVKNKALNRETFENEVLHIGGTE